EQLARRAAARAALRDLRAAQRRHDELTANAALAEAQLAELRALVEATDGMEPGEEERLRTERERHRHVAELASGAAIAAEALAPDEGEGASGLEAEPGRLEQLEAELDRIAAAKRRFRCTTYEALLERREEAEAELSALDGGSDPAEVAARELAEAEARVQALALELRAERNAAAPAFADAVASELRGVGMGEGEFLCEVHERDELGSTGGDDAVFLVRPNAGLPFAPVAETASGGELSRNAHANRAARRRGTEGRARADARRTGVPGRSTRLGASSRRPSKPIRRRGWRLAPRAGSGRDCPPCRARGRRSSRSCRPEAPE